MGLAVVSNQRADHQEAAAVLWFILTLAIVGFIVGLLARAIVPGPDSMGILGTIFLGLAGSFVGGFLLDALFRDSADDRGVGGVGLIGSTIGAILLLLLYRAATRNDRGALRR